MYGKEPEAPPPPPPSPPPAAVLQIQIGPTPSSPLQISAPVESSALSVASESHVPGPPVGAFLKQLEDDALLRGYSSTKDYEDSVVAIAKEIEATGTKVVFAPHLQHLAPRLGPSTS